MLQIFPFLMVDSPPLPKKNQSNLFGLALNLMAVNLTSYLIHSNQNAN